MKTTKKFIRILLVLFIGMLVTFCSKDSSIKPDSEPIVEKPIEIEEVSSVPQFKLTSPQRSAFLQEGTMDDMNITIQGEACDDINTVTDVAINGIQATLSAAQDCKTFSSMVNSTWGLNIIDGIAKNNLGDEVALVQSFIRSSEFSPAPTTSKSFNSKLGDEAISGAWLANLGNEFLDDKDRTDLDDFATAMNLVINKKLAEELYPKIPNSWGSITTTTHDCGSFLLYHQHTNRGGIKISKSPAFKIGKVDLGLAAKSGKIELEFEIGYTELGIIAEAYEDLGCLHPNEIGRTVPGYVSFDAVQVKVDIFVQQEGDSYGIAADLQSLEVNFIGEKISLELTNVNFINDLISNLSTTVLSTFLNVFEDFFPYVVNYLSDGLQETFKQFGTTLPTISIPEPMAIDLIVDAENDLINIGEGFIELGVGAYVTPSAYKKSEAQLAHGSIIGSSTIPTFEGMNGSFGLGLKHDFVNQVLWAVWAGGGFDLPDGTVSEIISALNASGLNATVKSIESNSPPIIMPGNLASEIKIGIGDILVKANVPLSNLGLPDVGVEKEISVYVSIILTSKLQLNPDTREISFQLIGEPEIHVAIDGVVRNPAVKILELQFADMVNVVIPQRIFDVMKSIELPSFPIGIIDGVPAGTKWVLGNGLIDQSLGYSRLIGTVEVEGN